MATISERLKAETAEHHTAAERHPFQRSLVRGTVGREGYAEYLGQMLLVHAALEAGLRRAAPAVPAIAKVVREEQYQEPYLRRDLAHFGVDPAAVTPSPATAELVARLERVARERPLALLGHHYVLEGSNNGSRFIARAIRSALGLSGREGTEYLDPYGEAQRANWAQFKADLDACGLSEAEGDVLVKAAAEMFEGIHRISEDLSAAVGA